jgi:hypothetical protein
VIIITGKANLGTSANIADKSPATIRPQKYFIKDKDVVTESFDKKAPIAANMTIIFVQGRISMDV